MLLTAAFLAAITLLNVDISKAAPSENELPYLTQSLDGFNQKEVVAVSVLSRGIACVIERKPLEVQERIDDYWERLIFTFVDANGFNRIKGLAPIEHKLDGKAANINDPFLQIFRVDDDTALLSVSVTEGHYDEEVFYHHGYVINVGREGGPIVKRVFRQNYDGANMISSASVGDNGKVYVIYSTEDDVDHRVAVYDLSDLDRITRTVSSKLWPDSDTVRYPIVGYFKGKLFALEQMNREDDKQTQTALVVDPELLDANYFPIQPDSNHESLSVAWHKSNGKFVQSQDSIFGMKNGNLWKLKMGNTLQYELLGTMGNAAKGAMFLSPGTVGGKLYLLSKDSEGLRVATFHP